MRAPKAKKIAKNLSLHGDTRVDNYYWLNERENQEVIDYLNEENSYKEKILAPTEKLQEKLFDEIVGRIKKDDESAPYRKNGYWYYTRFEAGGEYPIYCRKPKSLNNDEEILLDVNILAKEHSYYQVGGISVSPNNKFLVYGEDTVSRRIYTLKVKNLETGKTLDSFIKALKKNMVFKV